MKSCREMRREAWAILKGRWFGRLLAVGFALQFVMGFVNGLVSSAFAALAIDSLGEFAGRKIQAWQTGLGYTLPTLKAYGWMVGGFLFQTFIAYVFAAIMAYGFMGTLLKAQANDDNRWFADAFGGFSRPFEVTGLLVLMNLKVMLWSLLLFFPGIVAIYRYRLAWFLKNEHPDWTASACLTESGRQMKGFKWKAFCLDFSYIGWYLLAALGLGGSVILLTHVTESGGVIGAAASFLVGALSFCLFLKVVLGVAVSRVVFYRELAPKGA